MHDLKDEIIPEMKIPLTFKWSGREYKVDLLGSDR